MQINGIFSVGGGAVTLSSSPPAHARTLRALKGFNPSVQLPSLSICPSDCRQEKPPRGPRLSGSIPLRLHWAGPSAARKSLSAEELKGLLLRGRLTRRQRLGPQETPRLPLVPLGPLTSAAPPAPDPVTPRPAWHQRQFPGPPAQELGPQHLEKERPELPPAAESPS